MTISGEAIAVSTTSATLAVATQHLPIWVLAIVGLVGGFISLVNSEKITLRSSVNFLLAGACLAAILTDILIGILSEHITLIEKYPTQMSLLIALVIGGTGHLIIAKFMQEKGKVVDAVVEKAINQIKK